MFKSDGDTNLKVKKVFRLDQLFPDIKTKVDALFEHEGFYYFFWDKW